MQSHTVFKDAPYNCLKEVGIRIKPLTFWLSKNVLIIKMVLQIQTPLYTTVLLSSRMLVCEMTDPEIRS